MGFIFRLFILLVVIAAAGGGIWWYNNAKEVNPQTQIRLSGNIEVTITDVSFKIGGKVIERPVDEGYMVKKGDPIASLDDSDLKCDVALREAELVSAKSTLAELEAGSRPEEIASAKAAMEQAQFRLADMEAGSRPQEIAGAEANYRAAASQKIQAQADYIRARQLFEKRTISSEEYDAAKTAYDVAAEHYKDTSEKLDMAKEGSRKQQIEQARSAWEQAKAQYALVKAGPRQETKDQARARVQQATAEMNLAQTKLSYAQIFAPMSGVVLSKNIEPGEYVAPGTPVVSIGDLVNVWLRAYIPETDLGRIKVGQKANVTTDTYPGKVYQGRVSFISSEAEFTPKNVQTEKERVKLVYRIKIDITNPNMELKPGMPADAVIDFAK